MKNLYKSSHLAICFNSPHAFTKPSRHTHTDMYEICYCLKGDKKFVIGDQTYTLNNASLLLINKNTAHGFEHNRNSDACCLHFSREFLGGEIIEACSKFNILNIFSGEKIFYDFSRNIYLKIQIENIGHDLVSRKHGVNFSDKINS
ncbi:MAG TPA: hypothetical protein DC049_11665 [Spirochaetia bacterium]|nr:hypothetical protein [Spirochaetia bacterium]